MKTRDWIYVGLLAFIAFGLLLDAAIWPYSPPRWMTANDLVQMVGNILLVSWWQIADVNEHGCSRTPIAKLTTVLFAPLGQAIYLYQSRPWKRASLLFFGFIAGVLVVATGAVYLAAWLVETHIFPPEFT
ncbi:hypothetical protein ACQZ6C_08755 [Rhizobium rhizogenes]